MKVRLLKEQIHPKGNIPKGAIYQLNRKSGFYEYKTEGIVVSTINEAGVNQLTDLFERVLERVK